MAIGTQVNNSIPYCEEREVAKKNCSDISAARCAICEKRIGVIPFKGQAICRNCLRELWEI